MSIKWLIVTVVNAAAAEFLLLLLAYLLFRLWCVCVCTRPIEYGACLRTGKKERSADSRSAY